MADVDQRGLEFPALRIPSVWRDLEDMLLSSPAFSSGLTIYEDDKNVYVQADVAGVDPKDIEVTFDKGTLWIRGEAKEEAGEKRKYYRRATRSYSYRVAVPGNVDTTIPPEASYSNGVLTVKFVKSPTAQPQRIEVKGA